MPALDLLPTTDHGPKIEFEQNGTDLVLRANRQGMAVLGLVVTMFLEADAISTLHAIPGGFLRAEGLDLPPPPPEPLLIPIVGASGPAVELHIGSSI